MKVDSQTAKSAKNQATPAAAAASGKSPALTTQLKSMTYEEGAQQLAPRQASAEMNPYLQSGGTEAAATKRVSPSGLSPWYEMPIGFEGLPAGYAEEVPTPAERKIRFTFYHEGSETPVKLYTTAVVWEAYKTQTELVRQQEAKADAAAINVGKKAPPYDDGKAGKWAVHRDTKPDKNGFHVYRVAKEVVPETDPYKLGFTAKNWSTFNDLQTHGWSNGEIQKLCNIEPGFFRHAASGEAGPMWNAAYPAGGPVPTKYALAHRKQIYPGFVSAWTETTAAVD